MRNFLKLGGIAALGLGSIGSAFAEVPAAFTSAVAEATTSGEAMAGALVGVAAAIVVIKIAMGYVKSLKGAAK